MNRVNLIHVLVAAIAAASVAVSNIVPTEKGIETSGPLDHTSKLKESFDKIDAYLVKSTRSDKPEDSIKAAKKWLDAQRKANGDKDLIEALKVFTSLEKIAKKGCCTSKSLEILIKNDEATGGHVQASSKDVSKLRRIDRVIEFYATKQADTCMTTLKKCKVCKENSEMEYRPINGLDNQRKSFPDVAVSKASEKSGMGGKLKSFLTKLVKKKAKKKSSGEGKEETGEGEGEEEEAEAEEEDDSLMDTFSNAISSVIESVGECCGLLSCVIEEEEGEDLEGVLEIFE